MSDRKRRATSAGSGKAKLAKPRAKDAQELFADYLLAQLQPTIFAVGVAVAEHHDREGEYQKIQALADDSRSSVTQADAEVAAQVSGNLYMEATKAARSLLRGVELAKEALKCPF